MESTTCKSKWVVTALQIGGTAAATYFGADPITLEIMYITKALDYIKKSLSNRSMDCKKLDHNEKLGTFDLTLPRTDGIVSDIHNDKSSDSGDYTIITYQLTTLP
jgi:hypothetical protein